jgi:hypothetical protein
MQARVKGMFDNAHVLDGFAKDFVKRGREIYGDGGAVA